MKRVLVASIASTLLLAQLSEVFPAGGSGPFDGRWIGSARLTVEQCKSAKVTRTVEGTTVIGQAQFANDAPNISRTVRGDGSFGATIGWQPLVGKFSATVRIVIHRSSEVRFIALSIPTPRDSASHMMPRGRRCIGLFWRCAATKFCG